MYVSTDFELEMLECWVQFCPKCESALPVCTCILETKAEREKDREKVGRESK